MMADFPSKDVGARRAFWLGLLGSILVAVSAFAQTAADTPPPAIDSGDTAWMLTSTALVLMMTAPGLALFYGGLVRRQNILSVLMHCLFCMAMLSSGPKARV